MAYEMKDVITKVREGWGLMLYWILLRWVLSAITFCNLLKLRKLLWGCGNRMIICNVAVVTRGVFVVIGLEDIFSKNNYKENKIERTK